MENQILVSLPGQVIEYINKLEKRLESQQVQIDRLTELLRLAQKARFGSSSEKAKYIYPEGIEQLTLFNEAEVCAAIEAPEPEPIIIERHTRKRKRTKDELVEGLPVKEVIIDIPEDGRICDICEGELKAIGRESVRKEINIIPAQAFITETIRINYACGDCAKETDEANIVKPEVPAPVVKRGLASPSSVAHVIYQKYVNAQPLYRQEKDWENFGIKISRATLANWIIYTATHWLLPLWMALKIILVKTPVIMADESVVQVLKEPGKTPQSESRMWVYCTGNTDVPPVILFEYQPDRAGDKPKAFLKDAKDFYLQTDAYAGYNAVEGCIHCACWAHMRRRYTDALPKNAPKDSKALIGLEFCQKLFELERKFENLTPEERFKQRIEHSKPVLDDYFAWVETVNPLAGSKLAQAITYARNQKEALSNFLLDGRIEISTNRVENHIRPFAVGRRNWLFSDTVDGAKSSAIVYSIVQTACANGLNPYLYLNYLFTHLPNILTKDKSADLSQFFPWIDSVQNLCRLTKK